MLLPAKLRYPLENTPDKGFLVAFEGIDGSGKSTQAALLVAALKAGGRDAVLFKEPTLESPHGKKIRGFTERLRPSPSAEAELYALDREHDAKNNILPALEAEKIVVMDRYVVSSLCYQGALGADLGAILERNSVFPWPDLTIIADIDLPRALARIAGRQKDGFSGVYEKESFLAKVGAILDYLDFPTLIRIDGSGDPREIGKTVLELVSAEIEKKFRKKG
jgi:dTMP kinase